MEFTDVERGLRAVSEITERREEDRKAREKRLALLRRAIDKAGTQKALARQLGLSRVQVTRWVRGDRPVPDRHIEMLHTIAGGL